MDIGKIFKKISNGNYKFRLVPYETKLTSYTDVIKEQKKEGYRQVLFNVELMQGLVKSIEHYPNFYLKKIKMCSDADVEVQEIIDDLVLKSRTQKEIVYKIISELEWYSDKESIDVVSIEFFELANLVNQNICIKSNGVILGDDIESSFQRFISPQLMRYFNED